MRTIRKIALTELQNLFYSPIAWLILIVFTFQSAMAFTDSFGEYVKNQEMNYSLANLTLNIYSGIYGLFSTVQEYLYLYIPLITMGLMSRELSSGSIKLLYSSPITNTQIILGKFLSMLVYGLVLIAILFVFVLWGAFTIKDFDFPLVLSGLLGLYLLICAYAGIGIFMSSLTSYQVVAAIGTLTILAVLNYIGRIGQTIDIVRDITYWLAIGGRANEAIGGLICSEDIFYFVIVTTLFLTLSILRLKAIRQKSRWQVSFSKYICVFLLAMLLGYITSRPKMMGFYDATRTKQRTLTENSQDIIKRAEGGLTMTTYINILEEDYWSGLPRNKLYDMKRFSQYVRFKPEMKMKYVYYYRHTGNPDLERRYPDMTDLERVGKICQSEDLDSTMFISPEEIDKIIDLKPEGYRMVRLLERENGERTFLRMFDDMQRYPGETEISAALKRMVMDLPVVGYVTGHGERDINNNGDRGYFRFSQDKPFRYALLNQGFDCEEFSLKMPVPAHIRILMIADMRNSLTEEEQRHLDEYIDRGGNLFILGEPRRQEVMNPLIARLGVQFMPGQLVKYVAETSINHPDHPDNPNREKILQAVGAHKEEANNFQADFIIASPTAEAGEIAYHFETMRYRENVITMPGCVGLDYTEDKGFKVTPLFVSDTLDSWNELETSNFIDDTVYMNPGMGETERSYPTVLALSREINGKEQKIVIAGDADCISNSEISIRRSKVRASNFTLISGAFFWMSDEEVPIDVRRPRPPDNKLYATKTGVKVSKWTLMGAFPLLLLAACLLLWLRRRGR